MRCFLKKLWSQEKNSAPYSRDKHQLCFGANVSLNSKYLTNIIGYFPAACLVINVFLWVLHQHYPHLPKDAVHFQKMSFSLSISSNFQFALSSSQVESAVCGKELRGGVDSFVFTAYYSAVYFFVFYFVMDGWLGGAWVVL